MQSFDSFHIIQTVDNAKKVHNKIYEKNCIKFTHLNMHIQREKILEQQNVHKANNEKNLKNFRDTCGKQAILSGINIIFFVVSDCIEVVESRVPQVFHTEEHPQVHL